MEIVARFDPSASPSGTIPIPLSNGIGIMIVWNESNWMMDISFPNGDTDLAPAWTASIFALTGPAGQITWSQDTQLVSNSPPSSKVWVVMYGPGESIPGTYPLALVRQTTLGNVVPLNTAANAITNDGSIAGTQIIEATPQGDISSAVLMKNDGTLVLGNGTHKGSISSDNNLFHTDGSGNVLAANLALTGTLSFIHGSFTAISLFSGTGPQNNVNHGLGSMPNLVLLQYAGNFGGPPSDPLYWWGATNTVVNVHASVGFFWYGLAIRF